MGKKHPYDYVNKDNFDIIRGCIVQGMTLQTPPKEIAENLIKITGLPAEVCVAIVSQEIGNAFDEFQTKGSPLNGN